MSTNQGIKSAVSGWIEYVLVNFGVVIATLIIGIFVGWWMKFWLSDKGYRKQIDLRIKDKEAEILTLKRIVYEKLSKVTVDTKDKTYFKKILEYFKKG